MKLLNIVESSISLLSLLVTIIFGAIQIKKEIDIPEHNVKKNAVKIKIKKEKKNHININKNINNSFNQSTVIDNSVNNITICDNENGQKTENNPENLILIIFFSVIIIYLFATLRVLFFTFLLISIFLYFLTPIIKVIRRETINSEFLLIILFIFCVLQLVFFYVTPFAPNNYAYFLGQFKWSISQSITLIIENPRCSLFALFQALASIIILFFLNIDILLKIPIIKSNKRDINKYDNKHIRIITGCFGISAVLMSGVLMAFWN